MRTIPNPPTPGAARPTAAARPVSATLAAAPSITLDATTFRRFVIAAWGRPRAAGRTGGELRPRSHPTPDALGAGKLQDLS